MQVLPVRAATTGLMPPCTRHCASRSAVHAPLLTVYRVCARRLRACRLSPAHRCVRARLAERAEKLYAYTLQFKSRSELAQTGQTEDCPYDRGISVIPPPK